MCSGGVKKRAKKDKNAPKRGLSAFMFYSNAVRDEVKKDNPGIAFGEVGRAALHAGVQMARWGSVRRCQEHVIEP